MKKAKIMLTSIAILAIIGGALAFKAISKFSHTYCIKTTIGGTGLCTMQLAGKEQAGEGFYYTTDFTGAPCTEVICTTPSIRLGRQ